MSGIVDWGKNVGQEAGNALANSASGIFLWLCCAMVLEPTNLWQRAKNAPSWFHKRIRNFSWGIVCKGRAVGKAWWLVPVQCLWFTSVDRCGDCKLCHSNFADGCIAIMSIYLGLSITWWWNAAQTIIGLFMKCFESMSFECIKDHDETAEVV